MAAKKVTTTVYLRPDQLQRLRQIQLETGVPMAEFIRRAVDQVLEARGLPPPPETEEAVQQREQLLLEASTQLMEVTRLLRSASVK